MGDKIASKDPPRLLTPCMSPIIESNNLCLNKVKFFKYLIFFLFKLRIAKLIIKIAIYNSKFILSKKLIMK